jgi:hypothetical protein
VKRSGRDESIWAVIHTYMEAMQGISLYSYPYLTLAEHYVFLIIASVYSSTKLEKRAEQVHPGRECVGERGAGHGGQMAQTIYVLMNKRINKPKKI